MPTRSSYEPGTPCWIDLASPDVDAAKAFYSEVFGWEADDQFDDDVRIYTNFHRDGQVIAGLGSQPDDMTGMPPVWNTYIATDDVDATLAKVEQAGGNVMLPTMQVMDQGTMAVFADPTGAVLSVWQPDAHIGAQLVNEANTWSWNELQSREVETAKDFGRAVFGWEFDMMDMPDGPYHVVQGGEQGVAGLMDMPEGVPDEVPDHWLVYFTVEDAQATIDAVVEAGGSVSWGPEATPVGLIATVHDPHGGTFAVMQPIGHPEQG